MSYHLGDKGLIKRTKAAIGDETQSDFALRAGIKLSSLSNILTGKSRSPGVYVMAKIAAAANVNLEWLATGHGHRSYGMSESADTTCSGNTIPMIGTVKFTPTGHVVEDEVNESYTKPSCRNALVMLDDSFAPFAQKGSHLILENADVLSEGDLVYVHLADEAYLRRVHSCDDPEVLTLSPIFCIARPLFNIRLMRVSYKSIRVIYRVVGIFF